MVGKRFGRLKVVEVGGPRGGRLLCLCDCGTEVQYMRCKVVRGLYTSCGCKKKEQQDSIAKWTATHGHAKTGAHTKAYRTWQGMLNRCRNKNQKQWKNYGGRGIRTCKRWTSSFENFLADMGDPPYGYTLDRIDNNKGYEPSNCRWATRKEQRRNSSQVTPITIFGRTMFSWEWASLLGATRRQVYNRFRRVQAGRLTELGFLQSGENK